METQEAKSLTRDDMLDALMTRDGSCDGLFFAAVTTTGLFCRPSCPARKPRPQNVEFYGTAREALMAGFRPCLRCRPLEEAGKTPDWVRGLIATVEAHPATRVRDSELKARGLDPAVVRRHFQESYGLTFQAYSRARRLATAFAAISEGAGIDEVVFSHGWASHSGFREAFGKVIGVAPGKVAAASRTADAGEGPGSSTDFVSLAWIQTPLGTMVAGATPDAVCLLEFMDRRAIHAQLAALERHFAAPLLPAESPLIEGLRAELAEYFAGKRRSFDLPLVFPGSEFQRRVWTALRSIPYGETRSYAELAREIGEPKAARAVGSANGKNRIAILIPCHRVIAADGGLGGYGGGLWRKLRLLETEGVSPRP